MGGCCCGKQNTEEPKVDKKKNSPEKSDIVYQISRGQSPPSSPPSSDSGLISDEKLAEEQKHRVKAGESAYEKQRKTIKLVKIKSIADSQYNKMGLIDENSNEFQTVKNFLKSKNYEVICSIGSGQYAEVYKVFSPQFKKCLAVKVIELTQASSNYREKFLHREVDILKDCKHPNIIKMHEIIQTKNKVYMIMEWATHGTFADWLKNKGVFTESIAHTMFTKVLAAVYHMHSQKIGHRDIKLENILVDRRLIPKISDFSFAVKIGPNWKLSTTHCGSLPYFAPEILQKHPYDPLISDIWSLGVCFYIMLNDGLPFKILDEELMLKKQLSREWKFRAKVESQLSPELKSMIRKMLEPNTKLRITAAQLLEDPWIKNFANKD